MATASISNNRPAAFDARVIAYLPGLRSLAAKMVPRAYREDLVTDTVMFALERWQNYREDGGMWNWLAWNMRGIVTNGAKKAANEKKRAVFVQIDDYMNLSVPGSQAGYTELSDTLRNVATHRHGSVLLRRAMGDGLKEIADERGTSVEWVRQMEVSARAHVRAAA